MYDLTTIFYFKLSLIGAITIFIILASVVQAVEITAKAPGNILEVVYRSLIKIVLLYLVFHLIFVLFWEPRAQILDILFATLFGWFIGWLIHYLVASFTTLIFGSYKMQIPTIIILIVTLFFSLKL